MSRYGDTPLGMVESAFEFLRICEDLNYYSIVLSMKASNPQVMVQAYRLLINKMEETGRNYPLHLGVTEAGGGEDGRIKSAIGIGTLLEDGIGDTVRVSLTEDPEFEAPVAISLVSRYSGRNNHLQIPQIEKEPINPFEYKKRKSFEVAGIGGENVPVVFADFSNKGINNYNDLEAVGYHYDEKTDKWNVSDAAADIIYLGNKPVQIDLPVNIKPVYKYEIWAALENKTNKYPLFSLSEYISANNKSESLNFIEIGIRDINIIDKIKGDKTAVLILKTDNLHGMAEQRRLLFYLVEKEILNPVIIKRSYSNLTIENVMLYSSTDLGALLLDGFGDGVWLETSEIAAPDNGNVAKLINSMLFGILQAVRLRISRTEYIACPSCGRTLFDLQEVTAKIRSRTEHLKGVKIGIMGCIVNGPGEMADADYGYVGSGFGKITLYKGKEVVRRNVDSGDAVDLLIELIKEDNKWIEPV
jgi:(E)-4-hydroxy-3-methylbut-2-enyl-diphosphate synthase